MSKKHHVWLVVLNHAVEVMITLGFIEHVPSAYILAKLTPLTTKTAYTIFRPDSIRFASIWPCSLDLVFLLAVLSSALPFLIILIWLQMLPPE